MCLDCGCGEMHNNHGNPLHLTVGRFKLIARLNDRGMLATALIITATLLGLINKRNPLGSDKIEGEPKRIKAEPERKPTYVPVKHLPKEKKKREDS
jgi:hypothetical protein